MSFPATVARNFAVAVCTLFLVGCATVPRAPSQLVYAQPLKGQGSARVLVDKDDCDRASTLDRHVDASTLLKSGVAVPNYGPCMIARGYEIQVVIPVQTFKGTAWSAPYLVSAEQSVTGEAAFDALALCAGETIKAVGPLAQHLVRGDVARNVALALFLPWPAGLLSLAAQATLSAEMDAIVERVYPLCLARRGFATRPGEISHESWSTPGRIEAPSAEPDVTARSETAGAGVLGTIKAKCAEQWAADSVKRIECEESRLKSFRLGIISE